MNSKCGSTAHCSVLFTETYRKSKNRLPYVELSKSRKMTFLENLKNSREFPPGISGTIDSRTGIPGGLVTEASKVVLTMGYGSGTGYHGR